MNCKRWLSLYLLGLLACVPLLAPAWADGGANSPIRAHMQGKPAPVTVYVAKKILTMERGNPQATAVAVAGGRILAVGSLPEVKAALGDMPFVVDETFKTRVIMPGLIDQHLHPVLGALTLATEVIAPEDWVLPTRTFKAALTPQEYFARLKAAEAAMKDPKEWLFSWGYHSLWHGPLNRKMLDSISATRPIFVWQRSVHEYYLNTPAIQALGLKEQDMKGKGDASRMYNWEEGHWWETGMNLILEPLFKVFASPQRMLFGLRQMVAYEHSKGVTAFMEPGALYTPDMWKLYQAILGADATPFFSYFVVDGRGYVDAGVAPDQAIADGERIIRENATGKVSFFPKQIKLFADGAIISQLMQMKDPYLGADGRPDPAHHGEWLITPQNLLERARAYWNAGYQIHIHVNGDRALEVLLDTLERCMRETPRADHRTVIVHFANSTEEQVARIARLGALVSANPYYVVGFAEKYAQFGLGPSRANAMVRSASVLRRHIPLSFHSDLPMGPSEPLYLAWCAVNRITPSGRVAGPEQRIGVEDALRAVTIEAAYSWRKENDLGSIAPGKTANFTVLEQDPLAVAPEKLKDVPIWGTVFEGRLFPLAQRAARTSAPSPTISKVLGSSLFPSCHRPGSGAEADGCGACSFNSMLAKSGVLNHLRLKLDAQESSRR